jgi:CRP-like cAMP-binding protein
MSVSPSGDNPLLRKVDSLFSLNAEERQALLNLPMQVVNLKADQDIVREGDSPSRCCVVLEGWVCAYKTTSDGRRQIVAFTVPGDIPDLQSLHLQVLDTSIGTLEPSKVGFIQHDALHKLCERYYGIASALWRETLVDASIFRTWMLNIGQRDAYSRVAHIICELWVRLRAVGLAGDHTFDLPITQAEFGDALGISTVHVNRVLQEMRADGLIETKGTRLTVPDWGRLKEVGGFDPTYLHLKDGSPASRAATLRR